MSESSDWADIEEIKRLKSRYFYCMDHKDWDGWRNDVFVPDCIIDVPEAWKTPLTDLETFIAENRKVVDGSVTIHHGHMPEIHLTSPDSARGIWAMEDVIHWPENLKFRGEYTYLHGFGHYREEYVRTPVGWRIKKLNLTRLHLELK
jgi:hypothetical protein